ncbi:MFS transporter [Nocardiopsis algeriensis]|uniref:NNP family nitrate/nitrite transporter-like MFS transporter n=1 Tax=Nocardiopsis algeriensis TaxID=1478215 RepID=A0A841IQ35_9ACTN|nr:MFS transporter [Nocardiopsis algeriensis]MBB6120783.1 NNP family nitrate/nitrite transporter-like MFS transporter [Nocardiopsis algeriensis]
MQSETGERGARSGTPGRNLALATAAFTLTFWAWNMIAPLSRTYSEGLDLSPTQTSILVAFPVLVGSLGRIPVGMLTDRYGGRTMFTALCLISIVPVFLVGISGQSYTMLLVWGFFLGIAGTTFAIGIPFVNAWHEPNRRGFATGVFGAGMGGTALSAFLTPALVGSLGLLTTHLLMCAALAAMGAVMWLFSRDAPGWRPRTEPVLPRMREALKMKATWQASLLYALAFGGFVAFSTYMPTLLAQDYGFEQAEAGLRTAGFALAAVAARPLGGVLSDRIGPVRVCLISFFATCLCAIALTARLPTEFPAGTVFVLTAIALGLGTGGVFALVAKLVEPSRVGTVTGLVGAAGGLGGYFPPLLMGMIYQATGQYTLNFAMLALAALVAGVYTFWAFRNTD